VRALAERHADDLACVIVEPVAGNMGVVPPLPGFLEGLRAVCNGTGALLIADEVITGFRIAYGGGQERLAVRADLTCLGKIVGGGLPVDVYGGRREVMERVAPLGPVYQAGTLSGNPLAMAAGRPRSVTRPGAYRHWSGSRPGLLTHSPRGRHRPGRCYADRSATRAGHLLRRRRRIRHGATACTRICWARDPALPLQFEAAMPSSPQASRSS
jgi:hypothetical protein